MFYAAFISYYGHHAGMSFKRRYVLNFVILFPKDIQGSSTNLYEAYPKMQDVIIDIAWFKLIFIFCGFMTKSKNPSQSLCLL